MKPPNIESLLPVNKSKSEVSNPPLYTRFTKRDRPRPTDEMRAAQLELNVTEAKIDMNFLAMDGWLSPDGALYACKRGSHHALAVLLGKSHEVELEDAGWCKLTSCEWLLEKRYLAKPLTRLQRSAIIEWHMRNGFSYDYCDVLYED